MWLLARFGRCIDILSNDRNRCVQRSAHRHRPLHAARHFEHALHTATHTPFEGEKWWEERESGGGVEGYPKAVAARQHKRVRQ